MGVKVSVILPVYNTAKYLNKCIDSIMNQSMKEFELIIVNDNSSDNSKSIIHEYYNKYKNIKIINKTVNQGVSSARNDAIEIARGEYILFIDSDDWIEENMLERLYKKAIEKDADITICNAYIDFEDNKQKKFDISIGKDSFISKDKMIKELLTQINGLQGHPWNKFYRKDIIIKKVIRYDENISIYEDFLFNLQFILNSERFVFIESNLYHYIQRSNSLARSLNKKNVVDTKYIIEKVECTISNNNTNVPFKEEMISFGYRTIINNILLIVNSNESNKEKTKILDKLISSSEIKKYIREGLQINYIYILKYHRLIGNILVKLNFSSKLFILIWSLTFKPVLAVKNKRNKLVSK